MVNLVYTYLTRIQFEYDTCKHIEIGGSGGAIFLPYLVPHHSAQGQHRKDPSLAMGLSGALEPHKCTLYAVQPHPLKYNHPCSIYSFSQKRIV